MQTKVGKEFSQKIVFLGKKDLLKEYIENAKQSLRLLLTKKCNQNCIYCFEEGEFGSTNKMEQILDLADFKNIVFVAKKLGVKVISISGGEPTLFLGWVRELAALCHKNKLSVYVTTNGTNPKIAVLAKKFPWLGIRVSLDCYSRESYKKLTAVDAFQKCVGTLAKLSKLKNNLAVNRVIFNLENEWEKFNGIISLVKKLGLHRKKGFEIKMIPAFPSKKNSWLLLKDYLEYLLKHIPKAKISLEEKNSQFLYSFKYGGVRVVIRTRGIFSPVCCPLDKKRCIEGIGFSRINPDGQVQPCYGAFLGKISHKASLKEIEEKLLEGMAFLDNLYARKYDKKEILNELSFAE